MADWMTCKEIASMAGVHPSTVRVWIKAGHLKAHRFGGKQLRICKTSWEEYVKKNEVIISKRLRDLAD